MLNIVIPMAGKGSRFVKAGYKVPKPFIDVNGAPMIQRVVENLTPYEPYRFIFLARRDHEEYIKAHMSFATNVIYVDEVTEGAACTVLLARNIINSYEPLVIANSDQLVLWNDEARICRVWDSATGGNIFWRESNCIQDMINDARAKRLDASIATFNANHPKWSYARVDSNGLVVEVAEKKVISNHATVGVYYYAEGRKFVQGAERMISKNIRVNNEFYVAPVFNELIDARMKVGIHPILKMQGLGTPEDLEDFERKSFSL